MHSVVLTYVGPAHARIGDAVRRMPVNPGVSVLVDERRSGERVGIARRRAVHTTVQLVCEDRERTQRLAASIQASITEFNERGYGPDGSFA